MTFIRTVAPWSTRRKVLSGAAAVAVLAALVVVIVFQVHRAQINGQRGRLAARIAAVTCMNAPGTIVTRRPNRECVGVTDGAFPFDPALKTIEGKIHAENVWVAKQAAEHKEPFVSVAYLEPMSPGGIGILPEETVLEQLEGAYTAQSYANGYRLAAGEASYSVDGTVPLIKLLIANGGNEWDGEPATLRDLTGDIKSQNLVAVAGLGVSLASTRTTVQGLHAVGLPVVGASITADTFDNVNGLIRVASSNSEEVSAILSYVKFKRDITAALIADQNGGDTYDSNLVKKFSQKFRELGHGYSIIYTDPYSSADRAGNAMSIAERIAQMPTGICSAKPDVVLFAGRSVDLTSLLDDLQDRGALGGTPGRWCAAHKITIVSGDDATNVTMNGGVVAALKDGVTVYYAAVASGDASKEEWPPGGQYQGFTTFEAMFSTLVPYGVLGDGNSMMGYDGTLTAISAARLAGQDGRVPNRDLTMQSFGALHGPDAVPGASGLIVIQANYLTGRGSNPVGKPIPIMQLEPDGTPRFIEMTYPDGPPPEN